MYPIVFPRLVQQVVFIDEASPDYCHSCAQDDIPLLIYPSLGVWTFSGQEVTLEISIAYRLIKDEIHLLYNKFLLDYNQVRAWCRNTPHSGWGFRW